jgi:hypothetical protein
MQNFAQVQWSLHNLKTGAQMTGLTFSQIQVLVSSLSPADISNWHAWYEGQSDWKALSELMPLILPKGNHKIYNRPPMPPPHPSAKPKPDSKFDPLESSLHLDGEMADTPGGSHVFEYAQDGRIAKRFLRSYKVMCVSNKINRTFTAHTVDISLTGLQLDQDLPLGWEDPFDLTLFNKFGTQLTIIVSLVPKQEGDRRTRLFFRRVAKLDELHDWLSSDY